MTAAAHTFCRDETETGQFIRARMAGDLDHPAPPGERPTVHRVSKIGDNLKATFGKRYPGMSASCSSCRSLLLQLNAMTVQQAREEIDSIVDNLVERAPAMAPKLWQRIAARVDTMVDFGETRRRVTECVEEAISITESQPVPRVRPRARTVGFASAFKQQGTLRFVSSEQFQTDIKTLVSRIPSDVTAIAGVARSGLSAATMISMYLHLPMLTIRQTMGDVVQTGNGWRLGGNHHVDPKTQKILVVDDTVMTGNSLSAIEPIVSQQFGNVVTAAVYVNPLAKKKPDIWAVDLPWPHLLEWNLFNSILSPNMAVDFDGILCRDCRPEQDDDGPAYEDFIRSAEVLYVPRRVPIPMIVTARLEKYRALTEEWLDRHGISTHNLVMHPAKNLADRRREDIAAYKSLHFVNWSRAHRPTPPPLAFIESDDRQARQIARISGLMVICPAAAAVYKG